MDLRPGSDLAAALRTLPPGDTLRLLPGLYPPASISGRKGKTVIYGPGARIVGGACCLRFYQCGPVELDGLMLEDAGEYALFVAECKSLAAKRLQVKRAGTSGILTAKTSDVLIDRCTCNESRAQHGIYLSEGGDRLTIMGCVCNDNAASGCQVNAVPGSSQHVKITNNTLSGNQKRGAAAIQCAGCRDLLIADNRILRHYGRAGVALHADGSGKGHACRDVRVERNSFAFDGSARIEAAVTVKEGCERVVLVGNTLAGGVRERLDA